MVSNDPKDGITEWKGKKKKSKRLIQGEELLEKKGNAHIEWNSKESAQESPLGGAGSRTLDSPLWSCL